MGLELLEEARDPQRALDALAVELQGRDRAAAEPDGPQHHRVHPGQQIGHLGGDALALQHQPDRVPRVGDRQGVEPRLHELNLPWPAQSSGSSWRSLATSANRSPSRATRLSTCAMSNARYSGSPLARARLTSSHVTGVETMGRSRARTE